MNVQMSVYRACERGKEKKGETLRSLDSPDALFDAVSLGESSPERLFANSNGGA